MFNTLAMRARKAIVVRAQACILGAALWLTAVVTSAQPSTPPITLAELPAQARTTYTLIVRGGPFPYDKDGTVFGNRERLLPLHPRGYYREYTVKTPRVRGRGARRIVCGGIPRTPDVCYYTSDHYASFRKIKP